MERALGSIGSHLQGAAAFIIALAIAGCATTAPVVPEEEPEEEQKIEQTAEKAEPLTLETVYFEYDKYGLTAEARQALRRNVDKLLENPDANVTVDGHCDERGTDAYNMDLGWKRAYAVRDYLRRQGIADARLFPASYGRARPATRGQTEDAWAKNRRVEMAEKK